MEKKHRSQVGFPCVKAALFDREGGLETPWRCGRMNKGATPRRESGAISP